MNMIIKCDDGLYLFILKKINTETTILLSFFSILHTVGKCIHAHTTILGEGEWDSYDHHGIPTKNLSIEGRIIHM